MSLEDFLNSEEFYNLMQTYRHANFMEQAWVIHAFEEVKAAILKAAEEAK